MMIYQPVELYFVRRIRNRGKVITSTQTIITGVPAGMTAGEMTTFVEIKFKELFFDGFEFDDIHFLEV
jgi:uncharacterized membrane protein YdfJ with MMPL/SSD domain